MKRDGAVIFVRENARAIRGENGTVLYYEGTVEDITERKRMEEVLKENLAQLAKKNRYETIIRTVTQGVHKSIKLQDVLENAVEAMSRNIDEANNIFISLVEGEEAVLKAYKGYPDWFIERVRRIPYPKGATWKAIMEGKPRYCADVDQDTVIGPAGREVGTKSYVSMPIQFESKAVGCININSFQKNAFNEEELSLLEIVAHQIEIAINNAQQAEALYQANEELELRVKERTQKLSETNEELKKEIAWRKKAEKELLALKDELLAQITDMTHLHNLSTRLLIGLDLKPILEEILFAVTVLQRTDMGVLMLYDPERNDLYTVASVGFTDEYINLLGRVPSGMGGCGMAIAERRRIIIEDTEADPIFAPYIQAARVGGFRAIYSTPLLTRNGDVVGTIATYFRKPHSPPNREVRMVELYAHQAVNILENARLYRKAQEKITERERAESQIKESLEEKEVLLKEIQHRVKNNLQAISSLLNLQSQHSRGKRSTEKFNEAQNRVQSMALIHEILYQSEDLSRINLGEYIQNLGVYLFQSYGVKSDDIALKVNVDNISLGVDKAINCGLIINELVSNSLKHAFPRRKKGTIRIALSSHNDTGDSTRRSYTLSINDNGVGFPKDLDFRNTKSLGLQLVITLVKRIKGAIKLNRNNGTEFRIVFG
jgi:two-component sensor histidine kinase